jgi:hypothetical protein
MKLKNKFLIRAIKQSVDACINDDYRIIHLVMDGNAHDNHFPPFDFNNGISPRLLPTCKH